MVTLPESLKTYRDKAFQTAIDRVGGAEKVPDEFTVADCREFLLAKLSYLKIKTDYWVFLHDIWKEAWGPPLNNHLEEPFENKNAWEGGAKEVELDTIFDVKELWNVHTLKDLVISTWVEFDFLENSDIRISFWLTDFEGEFTKDFKISTPPNGWKQIFTDDNEFDGWQTKPGQVLIGDSGNIDLTPLAKLAKKAFEALKIT